MSLQLHRCIGRGGSSGHEVAAGRSAPRNGEMECFQHLLICVTLDHAPAARVVTVDTV